MSMNHSDTVRHALGLWRNITGIQAGQTSMRLADWELRKTFDLLDEAITLDPTEVTAMLLFDFFVDSYLRESKVTLRDLLDKPDAIIDRLVAPRELLAILNSRDMLAVREAFTGALSRAIARYDAAEREDVKTLLATRHDIALLRRDALRSMATLRVDQFLAGAPEPDHIVPVYHRTVHQWWNINSLLAAATRMPSGVSLNLVRDPDAYQSYFCFVIRNGGNLFVLSDREALSHPLEAGMRRRPERILAERAARNWFPYELLNLEYDEETRQLYIAESKVRELVAYQHAALPLKPVAELAPPDLVWITMMFDLIIERFWRQDYKAPALSYTAEMVNTNLTLANLATSSSLPVAEYAPLALPPIGVDDVRAANVSPEAVGKMENNPNHWMEERYASRIDAGTLNLLAAPGQAFQIEHASGDLQRVDAKEKRTPSIFKEKRITEMRHMDATTFGTRDALEHDRLFIARYNLAAQVDMHADAEYRERKDAVTEWYRQRVKANLDTLIGWSMHEHIWVSDGVQDRWNRYVRTPAPQRMLDVTSEMGSAKAYFHGFLQRVDANDPYAYTVSGGLYMGSFLGGAPLCLLNGTKASYYAIFAPTSPQELATLAGCPVEDLPDVLQHWIQLEQDTGNHILNRIDPMIWAAHNPWLQLDLSVRLPFSKRAIAQIEKRTPVWPPIANIVHETPWHENTDAPA
ncbi:MULTISPECIES: hypothetical protein [Cupriavidus]